MSDVNQQPKDTDQQEDRNLFSNPMKTLQKAYTKVQALRGMFGRPVPSDVGNGAAEQAADKMSGRKRQLDQAIDEQAYGK